MSGAATGPSHAALAAAPVSAARRAQVRWSLLFGNFVIGCGVMVVVGTLNDIARALSVSVAVAGQLVAVAAIVMCFGAPLLAGWVGALDRGKLLAAALAWYAIGHALCALAPSYAMLLPIRALTVLGAAVFTPQAAAAMGAMTPPAERAGAITFIFIGWSVASVVGMPISAWLGDTFGWRSAFFAIAAIGAVGAAWVLAAVPAGVRPATLTRAAWRAAFGNPVLMAIVVVTALAGAGQFTLFSYFAPYFKTVRRRRDARGDASLRRLRRLRRDRQRARVALRRPPRRRSRGRLRARADGALDARVAAGRRRASSPRSFSCPGRSRASRPNRCSRRASAPPRPRSRRR